MCHFEGGLIYFFEGGLCLPSKNRRGISLPVPMAPPPLFFTNNGQNAHKSKFILQLVESAYRRHPVRFAVWTRTQTDTTRQTWTVCGLSPFQWETLSVYASRLSNFLPNSRKAIAPITLRFSTTSVTHPVRHIYHILGCAHPP